MKPEKSSQLTKVFFEELIPIMRQNMYCGDEVLNRILAGPLDLPQYDPLKDRIFRPFNWGHSCGLTPEVNLYLEAQRIAVKALKDAKISRIEAEKKRVAAILKVMYYIFLNI